MYKLLHMNKINNVISHKNKKNDCISIYSCNNIVSKKDTNYADVLYYLINKITQLLPWDTKKFCKYQNMRKTLQILKLIVSKICI